MEIIKKNVCSQKELTQAFFFAFNGSFMAGVQDFYSKKECVILKGKIVDDIIEKV